MIGSSANGRWIFNSMLGIGMFFWGATAATAEVGDGCNCSEQTQSDFRLVPGMMLKDGNGNIYCHCHPVGTIEDTYRSRKDLESRSNNDAGSVTRVAPPPPKKQKRYFKKKSHRHKRPKF